MFKLSMGTIALTAAIMSAPALAADMPVKARPVVVDPTYDWSGFYVGIGTGGVWTKDQRFMPDLPLVGVPPTTFVARASDWIYNIHAGVQGQWGRWVIGLEGAYNGSEKQMRANVSVSPPEPFTTLSATFLINDLVTIGPKVGYTWDRLMVFGTGGYAGAAIDGKYTCTGTNQFVFPGIAPCVANIFGPVLASLPLSGKTWNNGWFAGVGFDYVAFTGTLVDLLVGAEYQHFDLERKQAVSCAAGFCAGVPHQGYLHDANGDIVRVRLTLKTHGWGIH
jgi:outer membrane immunogenic protein